MTTTTDEPQLAPDFGRLFTRLSKLFPRLASDSPGEVVATARAIGSTLASSGLDLHDLGDILATILELQTQLDAAITARNEAIATANEKDLALRLASPPPGGIASIDTTNHTAMAAAVVNMFRQAGAVPYPPTGPNAFKVNNAPPPRPGRAAPYSTTPPPPPLNISATHESQVRWFDRFMLVAPKAMKAKEAKFIGDLIYKVTTLPNGGPALTPAQASYLTAIYNKYYMLYKDFV